MTTSSPTTTVHTATLDGVTATPVQVEVDILRRLPAFMVIGLPGGAVREVADRVRCAIGAVGLDFPRKRVVVNLSPADVCKVGTGFDLPIAVGILVADGLVDADAVADVGFYGELSLDGDVRSVRGVVAAVEAMRDAGLKVAVVPGASAPLAACVEGIEVLGANTLGQVVDALRGEGSLSVARPLPPAEVDVPTLDMAEVRGNHRARRAMEIAAAGGHNILLVGAPGCGKTMLAARLPGILPAMSMDEALETTRVHDVAGLLCGEARIVSRRPFRAPHHTISAAGMVGSASLRPGELSIAHNGVLFLDEVPEFSRHVLELMRQPLDKGEVTMTRAAGTVTMPAKVQVVAAANPCPCGFLGHPTRPCTCMSDSVERYRQRFGGTVKRAVDLQVWVHPVDPHEAVHGERGESSADIRARVEAARDRQMKRQGKVNAQLFLGADDDADTVFLDDDADTLFKRLAGQGRFDNPYQGLACLRIARTIADLAGSERVESTHLLEAVSYRQAA